MVARLCREADEHGFYAVCICARFRQVGQRVCWPGSPVKVCTVVGFPAGVNEPDVKAYETSRAIQQGADEIDMVMNVGAAKAGDWRRVGVDVESVVTSARGNMVKVILETCLLSDEEKLRVCEVCVAAGAGFVKTSTGFNRAGATVEDVRLMRTAVGAGVGVKASGGIRDYADSLQHDRSRRHPARHQLRFENNRKIGNRHSGVCRLVAQGCAVNGPKDGNPVIKPTLYNVLSATAVSSARLIISIKPDCRSSVDSRSPLMI